MAVDHDDDRGVRQDLAVRPQVGPPIEPAGDRDRHRRAAADEPDLRRGGRRADAERLLVAVLAVDERDRDVAPRVERIGGGAERGGG